MIMVLNNTIYLIFENVAIVINNIALLFKSCLKVVLLLHILSSSDFY